MKNVVDMIKNNMFEVVGDRNIAVILDIEFEILDNNRIYLECDGEKMVISDNEIVSKVEEKYEMERRKAFNNLIDLIKDRKNITKADRYRDLISIDGHQIYCHVTFGNCQWQDSTECYDCDYCTRRHYLSSIKFKGFWFDVDEIINELGNEANKLLEELRLVLDCDDLDYK